MSVKDEALEYARDLIRREWVTKDSLQRQGQHLVTVCSSILTAVLVLAGFAASEGAELKLSESKWEIWFAVIALSAAGVLGLAAALPWLYRAPTAAGLKPYATLASRSDNSPSELQKLHDALLDELESIRTINNRRSLLLFASAAALAVATTVIAILATRTLLELR